MEKGLKSKLVKISTDAYKKRQRLNKELSPKDQKFIDANIELVQRFNDEAKKCLERLMEKDNDGKIRIHINYDGNVAMNTYPDVSNELVYQQGIYSGKMDVYLCNFLLHLKNDEEIRFTKEGKRYMVFIT